MTEGPVPDRPRRGRRNPNLISQEVAEVAAMDLPEELVSDVQYPKPAPAPLLVQDDIITMRSSMQSKIGNEELWTTFGVVSRVQPDEDDEEAFSRVAEVVNSGVMSAAEDLAERIELANKERAEAARNQRIQPRTTRR